LTTTLDSSPAAVAPAGLPRDPRERLAALFDPGTLELLPAKKGEGDAGGERSGVVAGVGLVHGTGAVAFATYIHRWLRWFGLTGPVPKG